MSTGYFSGFVFKDNSPIEGNLYLYLESNGSLIDSTISEANGYYYLETTSSGLHFIVCFDDTINSSDQPLIRGKLTPTFL